MEGRRSVLLYFIGFLVCFFMGSHAFAPRGFVGTRGNHFVLNGRPFYVNGFNAYWLMYMAADPSTRGKVSSVMQQASRCGMTLARTWAFSDGGYRPLQYSPGVYHEDMFKGLDFVVSEARKYGIHLILSLVNNYNDFGGRRQYVQWARERGQQLNSDDDFYRNPVVKSYYKNHIKGWITEMAGYLKSIDNQHLLEVGLEGFYGESTPSRIQYNPGSYVVGADFITNNQVPGIDFTTIHAYPDQWLPGGSSEQDQLSFVQRWVQSHIEDSNSVLRKPLLFAEFGKSSKTPGFTINKRNTLYQTVYNNIYASARSGGAGAGALFWQMLDQGMDGMRDGYESILVWKLVRFLCLTNTAGTTWLERSMDLRTHSACVFLVVLLICCYLSTGDGRAAAQGGFVGRSGNHFVLDGKPIYVNGFNAYWMMLCASDPSLVGKVTDALAQAAASGLTVARTWAFSDGSHSPLQYAPGRYDESMFKALDFVVSEAGKRGIKLILSLVNNYEDFGGRPQYVEWAKQSGQKITSDDDFYTNPVVKGYYKNHVKSWVAEMAAYLKSIDSKHLLAIGLEGFYGGSSTPDRKQFNPDGEVGTDFIANNQVPEIDFATIHAYSDQWLPSSSKQVDQIDFLKRWISVHTNDTDHLIKKPLLLSEFGLSSKDGIFSRTLNDEYYQAAYDAIYSSARSGGSAVGSLFWQLLVEGMDELKDGYEVVFSDDPSTAALIRSQSQKLREFSGMRR
ncbi:Mannan endo-1-4-beta-mannosidase 4 [Nymphaea thermarum]|nr:Mannan endo-1-4-beta-mannosidase 4 [Nymphaea thermarum]